MQKRGIILLLVTTLLLSCSPRALREAEDVVAQADSMRAAGQMYADTASLAQSYTTLRAWRYVHADDYAHACYHYGRLLREKDNPVEAMQVFIEATHSHTRDFHILGRVYSNMGDIAHLAGEYQLSDEMFKLAAESFLRNGDTLNHYFALTSSAFEKTCVPDINNCYAILRTIEKSCEYEDPSLTAYCNMVHGRACLCMQQYDSAIYYAHVAQNNKQEDPRINHILAQAYSFLDVKDSATFYALQVLAASPPLNERANALYILTNDDATNGLEDVRQLAANRSDIQRLLELRRGKMSQAAQLLEQDLNRKPDMRWLITIVGTLIVVSCIICIYVYRKRKRQALLSQQIEQLKSEYTDLQINKEKQLAQTCAILRASKKLQEDLCWKDFEQMCIVVNKHFYMLANKLRQKDVLNETEIRLCILVLLGLSRIEIASMLPYALSGVGKLKDHTAKLLGTTGRNLHDFLLNMAVVG